MVRRGRTSSLLVVGSLVGLGLMPPTAQAAVGAALFEPYVAQALPAAARGVAFGDVTGDGRTDVVASTDTSLVVMAQAADGSLAAPVSYATEVAATSANELAIGISDLDADGDNDVVLTTKAGLQLWDQVEGELEYDWSFWPSGARDLEVVDVSGDGRADLVVNTDAGIRVYWQIFGDLMTAKPTDVISTTRATEVEVGDVTGDGLPDIVSALGRTVEVRAQQPDSSFAAPVSYLSGGVSGWETVNGLALGDTSGDGRLDVHVTTGGNTPTGRVVTREQTPNGVLSAPQALASHDIPETIEAADVTGDRRDDLLVLHGGWNRLGVYDLTPGTNPAETLFPIPYASHYPVDGLAVGDVTGDGQADVGVADYNHGIVLLRHAPAGADVTPPQTTITSGPTGGTPNPTATFTFTSNEAGSFECQLDQGPFTPCTSPKTYPGLSAGAHSFQVRASDLAGNADPTPDYRAFQVSAPETVITDGPTGTVRSDTAAFAFDSGTTSAAGFQCQWDGGSWAPCTSPAGAFGLATGPHTFRVSAVSSYGVADPSPATRLWTVETPADLGVSTTAPATVRKNGTITWTTVVRNHGPGTAAGVALTQTVPPGVTSAKATGCTGSTTLTCPVGTLSAGASRTFTITGKVTATKGALASTATVTGTSWDRNTANDRATASSAVGR